MANTSRFIEYGAACDRGTRMDLSRAVRNATHLPRLWYSRYQHRRSLADLGREQLHDIGIDRLQAAREAAKPFWQG